MKFEWDEKKNIINQEKYAISFEEAQEVFNDPLQISKLDHRFNYFEERWITVGSIKKYQILVVANMFFSDEGEEIIRIISARKANTKEKISYEKC
ncbi:MAG: BrnT family toxin [Campylobacterota bacterium]|nr:BrnT family toxin [Campylobacterota bacterium]